MKKSFARTIRFARAADVPALVRLLGELFALEQDFMPSARRQRRGLKARLGAPRQWRIWVAEQEGQVVGMCALLRLVSTSEGAETGLVEDVVVQKDCRGQGIGGRLLEAAETWAMAHGLTRLQLLADRGNHPALRFYQRHGWQCTHLAALRKHLPRRPKTPSQ